MRLIIEITYHSGALAVSAERLSPDDDRRGDGARGKKKEERGEKQRIQRETQVFQQRRSCVRTRACRCVRADRVLFVRIVEPRTLISRFREIIRGGCVISFLVISCSTRRGMLCICAPACVCVRVQSYDVYPRTQRRVLPPSGPPMPVTAMHRDRADHLFINREEIYILQLVDDDIKLLQEKRQRREIEQEFETDNFVQILYLFRKI